MEQVQHQIKVQKTAHYFVLGDVKNATKLWIVFHGYGYSAAAFLKKFEAICDENTCIIAPEGLSKFYVNGVDGKVGASWMTKENRADEIKDYLLYLNELYNQLLENRASNPFKLNVLGFSQGGATAARWVVQTTAKPDNFIMWASVFPDDMPFEVFNKNNIKPYFLFGDEDVFLTPERVEQQKEILTKSLQNITIIPFLGKHTIPEDVLVKNVEKFDW